MTMNFRVLRDAIIQLLGDNANGKFRVVGYQQQGATGEENAGESRSVQVYFSKGINPKSAGSMSGSNQHDTLFNLDMTVAMKTAGDVATFNDPNATPAQLIAALQSMQAGEELVQDKLDELYELVYQIIQDPVNRNLGVQDEVIASRWLQGFDKDDIMRRGEFAVLTGRSVISARMEERTTGLTGNALETIDTGFDTEGDPTVRSGVLHQNLDT